MKENLTPKSVADMWEQFRSICVPKHAGTYQKEESERIFYAGVLSFFEEMMKLDLGDEDDLAPGCAWLESVTREMEAYKGQVLASFVADKIQLRKA